MRPNPRFHPLYPNMRAARAMALAGGRMKDNQDGPAARSIAQVATSWLCPSLAYISLGRLQDVAFVMTA